MEKLRYIDCCQHYEKDIIGRFEKAKEVKNFFTQEEIDDLRLYQFQNAHRCKFQTTSSNIQPIVDITDMFANLKWLTPKFEELFGKDSFAKEHSGNFYITAQPHDAHVDLPTEDEEENRWFDNLIPWKSVIVPLFLTHDTAAWTVFFNQRRIGYSVTFDRDFSAKQEHSGYRIARDYEGFIDSKGIAMDTEKDYKDWTLGKYPHISENNFRGLSEETVLEHVTGNLFIFDACQIHASVLYDQQPTHWIKNGINIQFYKEHNGTN